VKVAHICTSLARDSASGVRLGDIYIYIYNRPNLARDIPHTDEFDSLEPEPSRTREPDSYEHGQLDAGLGWRSGYGTRLLV
jgi:hypothetical protein